MEDAVGQRHANTKLKHQCLQGAPGSGCRPDTISELEEGYDARGDMEYTASVASQLMQLTRHTCGRAFLSRKEKLR